MQPNVSDSFQVKGQAAWRHSLLEKHAHELSCCETSSDKAELWIPGRPTDKAFRPEELIFHEDMAILSACVWVLTVLKKIFN